VAPPSAEDVAAGAASEIDTLIAQAEALPADILDESAVRKIVRDEITADPQFVLDALNAHVEKQQAEAAVNADKKTVEMAAAITEDEGYPFVGNKDGKIEVFYYFDINCGFCKKIDQDMERFVKANPDVKLVHREMPILTPSSKTAAHIGGTLFALYPDTYDAFHRALLSNPAASDPAFIEAALKNAVGAEKAEEVLIKAYALSEPGIGKQVDERIKATLATAGDAGINGTPFVFVKGDNTFVRGAAPDLFERLTASAEKLRSAP
jgi:protein-disulfide isomerase